MFWRICESSICLSLGYFLYESLCRTSRSSDGGNLRTKLNLRHERYSLHRTDGRHARGLCLEIDGYIRDAACGISSLLSCGISCTE